MSEGKANDDLYRRVEEHLQELLEPDLTETASADAWLLAADAARRLGDTEAFESCLQQAYERVREQLVGLHRLERLNGLLAAAG